MSKKKKQAMPDAERMAQEEMLDALLGTDYDIYDEVSADELLNAMDIDSSKLVSEFNTYLQAEVRRLERESEPVPQLLRDAMQSLRAEIKASDPMAVEPKDWISGLLSGTLPSAASNQYATSLRRGAEENLTAEDVEILESLKSEIEEENK